ncbi:hypothetical protein M0805_004906 [Coniferiporia weirii]|nr:hypothetical protein M0805_004906 [Coniferiporia weirii]
MKLVSEDDMRKWKDDAGEHLREPIPCNRLSVLQVLSPYSTRVARAVYGRTSKKPEFIVERIKKRKGRNVAKGKLKLSRLLTMPSDIFLEIASHIEPIDVLHLSRVSLELNRIFMSKQSRSIWRAARTNVQMPDCPDDLSEAQYISLLYEKDCQVCGSPNVPYNVKILILRVRLCRSCYYANVITGNELATYTGRDDEWLYSLVPCSEELDDQKVVKGIPRILLANRLRFFKPDFEEAMHKFRELKGNRSRRYAYVVNRSTIVSEIVEKARVLHEWIKRTEEISRLAAEHASSSRKLDILSRLGELGYVEADYPTSSQKKQYVIWEKLTESKKELTPRAWKTLQPKLEQLILELRLERAQDALDKRIKIRKEELRKFYIPPADLFTFPFVHARIHADDAHVEITQEAWDILSSELPQALQSHKDRVLEQCDALCAKAETARPNGSSEYDKKNIDPPPPRTESQPAAVILATAPGSLSLRASAFFKCGSIFCWDSRPVSLFALLSSHGNHFSLGPSASIDNLTRPGVLYAPKTAYFAKALLKDLAFSESTEMKWMLDCSESFTCLRCAPVIRKKMTWLEMVAHYDSECTWYVIAHEMLKEYKNKNNGPELRNRLSAPPSSDQDTASDEDTTSPYNHGRRPYWFTFINDHNVDEMEKPLVCHEQEPESDITTKNKMEESCESGTSLTIRTNSSSDEHLSPENLVLGANGGGGVVPGANVFKGAASGCCSICSHLRIKYRRMTIAALDAHIRAKHGKEPEERDMTRRQNV